MLFRRIHGPVQAKLKAKVYQLLKTELDGIYVSVGHMYLLACIYLVRHGSLVRCMSNGVWGHISN